MRYRVVHTTRYAYGAPVVLAHNEARLQPRATARQACALSQVTIDPLPAVVATREDFFGNRVLYFALQDAHDRLVVTASSEVEVAAPAPVALDAGPSWEAARARLASPDEAEARAARQFVLDSPCAAAGADVRAYAEPSFVAERPLLAAVADLSARIHRDFRFDPESTTVATPVSEVLAQRHGVCQDFAHLAIACLRAMGLPARYVSGYLETLPPPGQPRLQGADVSHAWFAVHAPGIGWVDFDPTNDLLPDERHVTTAWGRDYADVTPLKGVIFGGGAHTLEVAVDMVRLDD
ncbi:MAG: transglutaminase family protein [Deltaproteobacteria bacterium]|nr:transglutaminase family protein [Deltaproteobacteria bacterium]